MYYAFVKPARKLFRHLVSPISIAMFLFQIISETNYQFEFVLGVSECLKNSTAHRYSCSATSASPLSNCRVIHSLSNCRVTHSLGEKLFRHRRSVTKTWDGRCKGCKSGLNNRWVLTWSAVAPSPQEWLPAWPAPPCMG